MTGLAGYGPLVFIQLSEQGMIVGVGSFIMAVEARDLAFAYGTGGAATGYLMSICGMALLTGKILSTHMNIVGLRRFFEGGVKIPMLDTIPSASAPVTRPAIGPGGSSDILCNREKV